MNFPGSARWRALLLLCLAMIPCGITVHLGAEACALGAQSLTLEFLTRHLALCGIGLLSLGGVIPAARRYVHRRQLLVHALRRDLPWHGAGLRFFGLNWFLQLGFFALTVCTEPAPTGHGDWILGGLVALGLAAAGSVVIAFLPAEVARLITGRHVSRQSRTSLRALLSRMRLVVARYALLDSGYGAIVGCRPPPGMLLRSSFL